jgi:hypothetical protein
VDVMRILYPERARGESGMRKEQAGEIISSLIHFRLENGVLMKIRTGLSASTFQNIPLSLQLLIKMLLL